MTDIRVFSAAEIMSLNQADLNCIAMQAIEEKKSQLRNMSQDIWAHPELGYKEYHAHDILTEFLEKEGFKVERNFIHKTGFRATFREDGITTVDGGVNVCVICEYDALPEIGHACGHNLIAEGGVAAGIGIKAALDKIGCGQVTVLGTPAEEGGGGKLAMIESKVFDRIDIALMAHPCPHNIPRPPLLAKQEVHILFTGKASHAAAFPWDGINALDAAVLCYQSISVMRQQMKPTWRVHGIFTDAGVKPNIIPERAELHYYLRAPTKQEVNELKRRVEGCIQGAATATGCQASFNYTMGYLDLVTNHNLATIYEKHATNLGLEFSTDESVHRDQAASGDIGNVSQVVPTIQPGYSIHTKAVNHSKEFAQAAASASAHTATLLQSKVLALTALELMNPNKNELLTRIQEEFKDTFGNGE